MRTPGLPKFVKYAGGVAVFAFLGLVVAGLRLPSTWSVSRSVLIAAPPERIYPLVSDFKNGWTQWSASDFDDAELQYAYEGPTSGVGARRTWVSRKMGAGVQTLVSADPRQGVAFELETANKFRLVGILTFAREGTGTRVTWTDSGDVGRSIPKRYAARALDGMLGPSFEKSLAALKAKAEAPRR